jgi:CO/xanthine dehydrogenase Mo-binding subunit
VGTAATAKALAYATSARGAETRNGISGTKCQSTHRFGIAYSGLALRSPLPEELIDERARDVVALDAEQFGWSTEDLPNGRGRGFGFAQYKNSAAYCAVALEIEVERETGRVRVVRAVAAIDGGEVGSPDGIVNQTEGGIIQSISWSLYEGVTFTDTRITSVDWSTYPIMRFSAVPDSIEVHIADRPGQPFLGTGEAGQGPVVGALANAIRNAIGVRIYDLPFRRDRVKQAIGV